MNLVTNIKYMLTFKLHQIKGEKDVIFSLDLNLFCLNNMCKGKQL